MRLPGTQGSSQPVAVLTCPCCPAFQWGVSVCIFAFLKIRGK